MKITNNFIVRRALDGQLGLLSVGGTSAILIKHSYGYSELSDFRMHYRSNSTFPVGEFVDGEINKIY